MQYSENTYEDYGKTLKVNCIVEDQYEDIHGDVIKANLIKMLNEDILDIFEKSPFYDKYKDPKKVDKADMAPIFYHFKESLLLRSRYTLMEMFIGIAEFFDLNYKMLVDSLSVMDVEILMRELSSTQNVKNKIKTVKLF